MRRGSITKIFFLYLLLSIPSLPLARGQTLDIQKDPELKIDVYPEYAPKIREDKSYGLVFLVKVSLRNASLNTHWRLKVCIRDENSSHPGTQVWNGTGWVYSFNYAFEGYGNFSRWIPLRFCRRYSGYRWMEGKGEAILEAKCRIGKKTLVDRKRIYLLDMDGSTWNGTEGGLITGFVNGSKIILLVHDNRIVCISSSEVNNIDEGNLDVKGFFKAYAPLNMKLDLVDEEGKVVKRNLSAWRGSYGLNAWLDDGKIWIENTGTLPENVYLDGRIIQLYPGEAFDLPAVDRNSIELYVLEEPGIVKSLSPEVKKKGLDLEWIRIDGVEDHEIQRGRIYRVRAKIKNHRMEEVRNVKVTFYLDGRRIGSRTYESIGSYPRYPSSLLDTSGLSGYHEVKVEVTFGNERIEKVMEINVREERFEKILITKVFCYDFSWLESEFIEIHNPNGYDIDISGWYITDEPWERVDRQAKLIFPPGTEIKAGSSIVVSSNSSAYKNFFGCYPDFGYGRMEESVGMMIEEGRVRLNNHEDVIALKDEFNRTVDLIVYGRDMDIEGWEGKGIRSLRRGEYLERKVDGKGFVDEDKAEDWVIKRIGRSSVAQMVFCGKMKVKALVSPDCSLDSLIEELEQAERMVIINTYTFSHPRIADILARLAEKGVKVKVMIEGAPVGGIKGVDILNLLKESGVEVYEMRSCEGYRRYRYNHAKYCVIDNETLILGSANLDRNGYPCRGEGGNREWIVIIKNGSLARYFYEVFVRDLSMPDVIEYNPRYQVSDTEEERKVFMKGFEPLEIEENITIIPVLSPDNALDSMVRLIRNARESIYMEQMIFDPYDVKTISMELLNASGRGVDVRIIINSRYTGFERYMALRDHGVKVKLIDPSDLSLSNIHVKGLIVDNSTVLISSINLDYISIYENREAGLIIESERIATYFSKVFLNDWNGGYDHGMEDYKNHVLLITLLCITFLMILRGRIRCSRFPRWLR